MNDNGRVQTPPLPDGFKPLATQVAGHFYGQERTNKDLATKLGFLERQDGSIVKPIIPPKGTRELEFYKKINDSTRDDEILRCFRRVTPQFFGVWTTPVHPGIQYIKMENITQRFQKPSLMDVKVGPISYVPEAGPDKVSRERSKFPPQEKLGFRILGIRVYDPANGTYQTAERLSLRLLTEEEVMTKGLHVFLDYPNNFQPEVVEAFIRKLGQIRQLFEAQTNFHFYATSLLFVYDSVAMARQRPARSILDNGVMENGCVPSTFNEDLVDIRMIDFTHIRPGQGKRDENYLAGLQGLTDHLQAVLHSYKQSVQ